MSGSENSTAVMFHYVYVLQSQTGHLYVGRTTDLRYRLQEHNRGLNFSTKSHRPWHVIHYEAYSSPKDASRREKYLKTNQGGRLLKRMLKEYLYEKKKNLSRISTT